MTEAANTMPDAAMMQQLSVRVETLIRDNAEQRAILRDLTSAVSRLAVIEERQSSARSSIDRAFEEVKKTNSMIDELDARVKSLEIAHPANVATVGVVHKIAWLITAAVIGALLSMVLQRQPQQIQARAPVSASASSQ